MTEAAEIFMKYDYTETKELLKVFMTLVSGILVFSVVFSEKVVGLRNSSIGTKYILIASWGLLIFSLLSAGLAMSFIAAAAGAILYGDIPLLNLDYWHLALISWFFVLVAGAAFAGGLIAMVFAGARSLGFEQPNPITPVQPAAGSDPH